MLEGVGGQLAGFVAWAVAWAARLGVVAGTLWGSWLLLKVIFAGGSGREAWRAVVGLLVLAVVFGGPDQMGQTFELVGLAGQRVWAGLARAAGGIARRVAGRCSSPWGWGWRSAWRGAAGRGGSAGPSCGWSWPPRTPRPGPCAAGPDGRGGYLAPGAVGWSFLRGRGGMGGAGGETEERRKLRDAQMERAARGGERVRWRRCPGGRSRGPGGGR